MNKFLTWAALGALIAFVSTTVLASGEVVYIVGMASATNSKGITRELREHDRVAAGDVLSTKDKSEVIVAMEDNALVSLRANSQLKIDEYVAEGSRDDRSILTLYVGAVRAVTGWIGKIAPRNVQFRTASATVGIRGTDHEIAFVEEGAAAGTYSKVNDGRVVLSNSVGEVVVSKGGYARSAAGLPGAPRLLEKAPEVFKSGLGDANFIELKKKMAQTMDERLKARQQENTRLGKRTACSEEGGARQVLDEFLRAYENGQLNRIRERLDPAMVGYQRVIDDITQQINREKQIRVSVKDVNVQCGPDLAAIQYSWEKRFLDVVTSRPGFASGRASVLIHSEAGTWRLAGFGGENPFSEISGPGSRAQLNFGPAFSLDTVKPTPTAAKLFMEVVDADRTGQRRLQVQLSSSSGDAERIELTEGAPGHFSTSNVSVSSATAKVGDGVLQVTNGTILTLRYDDARNGASQPQSITKTISLSGKLPALDTTPDAFAFAPVNGVAPGSVATSSAAVISGIDAPAIVTVSNGVYAIESGAFGSVPGTVTNGQKVFVRVNAAPTPGTTKTAVLTIGGISASFNVTTAALSPATDTTPDPFTFAGQNNVPPGSVRTSNAIAVTGIDSPAPISVSNGSYAIGNSPFTTVAGTVSAGQLVAVRLTASTSAGVTTSATLNIGGVTSTFSVTTTVIAADTTPDPFVLVAQTGVPLNSLRTSNSISVTGINTQTSIGISNGAYSIDGGTFTSSAGAVSAGQSVVVRLAASASISTTTSATLTIGGVQSTFSVTTIGPSTTPSAFSFAPVSLATLATSYTSSTATINGINSPAPVSISGGTYSVAGGPFVTSAGTVSNGQTLVVRQVSSASSNVSTTATLTVGGLSVPFTVTTADLSPNAFSFPITAACGLGSGSATQVTSVPAVIGGINMPIAVSVTAPGRLSIAGGAPVSSGTISNGQTLTLSRLLPVPAGTSTVSVSAGQGPTVSATWSINCQPPAPSSSAGPR